MKIVMLCDFYGDKSQYQENFLGKYYTKYGHEVTILAATFNSPFDYYANKYNKNDRGKIYYDGKVKVIKLPYSLNIFNKLRKFPGVLAILDDEKPDLIYLHGIHLNIFEAVKYLKRNPKCKMIMDSHSDYSNSANNWVSLNILHKLIRKNILYRGIKYIHKIYPVVPGSAVFLNEVYKIPYQEMELLPLGVDSDVSNEVIKTKPGTLVRKTYGIPMGDIVIFTGGKISPAKKTHALIEAFLKMGRPELHLMILGKAGEDNVDYMNQLLRQSESSDKIHFVGWVAGNDIYKYMNACDLAVFPASQSVLWQQSLGMGLPIIVGKMGGQDSSYLNLYHNMLIIEEENINSDVIADKINEIIKDCATLKNYQIAALKVADEMLSYDKIVLKTLIL